MSRKRKQKQNIYELILSLFIIICIIISRYVSQNNGENTKNAITNNSSIATINATDSTTSSTNSKAEKFDLSTIPEYTDKAYVEINNNEPYFTEEDYTTEVFEKYSEWDELGRSGVAFANVCKETMPKTGEKREDISSIRNLSGWKQKRYDNLIKDKYLYNRCHLIGWQLSAENANKNNLITGTRYLNTEGMLPFENDVAKYIDKNDKNHVLYRVTPIYDGDNLLASGVEMEAWSVEDEGTGIKFNIYCYNVQPEIVIDYATGDSHAK